MTRHLVSDTVKAVEEWSLWFSCLGSSPPRLLRVSFRARGFKIGAVDEPRAVKIRAWFPVDETRKKTFLQVLAATGSYAAAASAATPWSTGKGGGIASFKDEMRRDPEFAKAVAEARQRALGRCEEHITKLAVDGVQRPIYQGGKLVGHETIYEPKLLLALLQRLDPDAWSRRERLEVEGRIAHGVLIINAPAKDEDDWETKNAPPIEGEKPTT